MSSSGALDYESKLLQNVARFGWQATTVFDPDGDDPTFTYSIGFTFSVKAPEFIVFGLEGGLVHSMLSEVYRQLQGGKSAVDGSRWSDVLEGVDCVARAVHPDNVVAEYLNSAIWYWERSGHDGLPPVLQLVWPGKLDGLFPWDGGCNELVRGLQPALYLPRHE